jgi:lipid A disaccharide synthetase
MKRIFISSGEASGDRLGAWYINHLREKGEKFEVEAGGSIYVKPGIIHEVLGDTEFYANVVVSNQNSSDKIVVE